MDSIVFSQINHQRDNNSKQFLPVSPVRQLRHNNSNYTLFSLIAINSSVCKSTKHRINLDTQHKPYHPHHLLRYIIISPSLLSASYSKSASYVLKLQTWSYKYVRIDEEENTSYVMTGNEFNTSNKKQQQGIH